MNKTIIPIFFSADNAYVPFLSVAIDSLLQNASPSYTYHLIVLDGDISSENKDRLTKTVGDRAKLRFVDMRGCASIDDRAEHRLRADVFTLTIYFRLFIANFFSEYDKAIYLDSDIVVAGDISKLYNTDLKDNLLGVVQDHSIENIAPLVSYVKNVVAVPINEYFNSGVLLMNLKELRNAGVRDRFLYLLNKYHFETVAPDQDYLNFICNGRVHYLESGWNRMATGGEIQNDCPMLIHYNLYQKPWLMRTAPYGDDFWKYAEQNDFYKEIMAIKNARTPKDESVDMEKMAFLISNAAKIEENASITFAKLLSEGKEVRLPKD